MKTADLIGPALDLGVAKAKGFLIVDGAVFVKHEDGSVGQMFLKPAPAYQPIYSPSTNWAQGGPLIESEGITVRCIGRSIDEPLWDASTYGNDEEIEAEAPLIAAMRCYVASKLGDEVEIPKELL